jgi:hypothetical protein
VEVKNKKKEKKNELGVSHLLFLLDSIQRLEHAMGKKKESKNF